MMTNDEVLKLADALCSAPAETDAAVWSDKLLSLLEVAVRTIDCELFALQSDSPAPIFPLVLTDSFPLSEELAPAAAYLAAYLAGGQSSCKLCYERALECYRATLEVCIAPTVDRYGF